MDFRLEVQTNRYRNWMSRQEMEQAALYYFGMDFIPSEQGTTAYDPEKGIFRQRHQGERRPPGLKSLFAGDGKKICLCFATKLIWMLHDTKDECRRIPF